MRQTTYLDVLQAIEKNPGIRTKDLRQITHRSSQWICMATNTLAKMPAIRIERIKQHNHFYPLENGRNLYCTSMSLLRRTGKLSLFIRRNWSAVFPSKGLWL